MTRAISRLAPAVADRSGGRCEALWHVGYRCPNPADAFHHRLPRARARVGAEHLLDLVDDIDNIAHLCEPCHTAAHGNPDRAAEAKLVGDYGSAHPDDVRHGITVDGAVYREASGRVAYVGTNPAYRRRYPA